MHWVNRVLLAVLVAACVAFVPEQLELAGNNDDLARVRQERAALVESNAVLAEEIRLLRAEVRALKTDPREVARIAREDLNLVAPGEVVFEVRHAERKNQPPREEPAKEPAVP